MLHPRSDRVLVVAAVVVWTIVVGAGVWILLRYSNTPGKAANPSADWPSGTSIQRTPGRATLVVFAHPQCPCSESSIGELAQVVRHTQQKLDVHVIFYAPEGETAAWVRAGLWQQASISLETRRFHAATSGQALLYDSGGHLRFSGGITASRGHSGDNDGRNAIVALVLEGSSGRSTTPVFGCSLLGGEHP